MFTLNFEILYESIWLEGWKNKRIENWEEIEKSNIEEI